MFVDTDPGSLPGSIIHFNRLLNDIAISQILGNESAQRLLEFVIRFMSKLSLKIRWTSTARLVIRHSQGMALGKGPDYPA